MDRDHPIPGRWQLGEWSFNRCPRAYLTEPVEDWLLAFKMFKNGFLPNKGGWLQQSRKFILVMCFIEGELAKHEAELREKAVRNGRKRFNNNPKTQ